MSLHIFCYSHTFVRAAGSSVTKFRQELAGNVFENIQTSMGTALYPDDDNDAHIFWINTSTKFITAIFPEGPVDEHCNQIIITFKMSAMFK